VRCSIRNTLALLATLFAVGFARAAEEEKKGPPPPGPWGIDVVSGLNLSQSAFSNNWSGGDQGSVAWVLKTDAKAERQFNTKFNWSHLLQLAYGQTSLQETDPNDLSRKRWRSPDKTTDLVLFESVGRWTLQSFVDPYLAFRLDSQFIDNSDPVGELMFNPIKLSETAGVARVLRKTEDSELITRLGFGFRQTFARSFVDLTGDDVESFSTNDGGFEYQISALEPILEKRVLYQGKLLLFWPVFYSQSDALTEFDDIALDFDPTRERVGDSWKAVDVNFQNTLTAQITKIISINLYVQLLYDKFDAATNVNLDFDPDLLIREVDGGIRKAGQFKETLAIGFTFKML
jgi:hypothetical protein